MSTVTSTAKPAAPYPGLRPFEESESSIFFGRASQVNALLTRLETQRILAVVGASGSGKSSLVRAGLLPALEEGMLFDSGDQWRMVVIRPGRDPLANLACGLLKTLRPRDDGRPPSVRDVALLQTQLRSGPQALVQTVEGSNLPPDTNVLVLVDQFEEIFRFRNLQTVPEEQRASLIQQRDDAAVLVDLLLKTSQQSDCPIYCALTMRSDFLGDCDAFHGLPEVIDQSQFLTPRPTHNQLREAIVGPARQFGDDVDEALVTRILNDVRDDPDQLPLMQHALRQVWFKANVSSQTSETMNLANYEQVGGMGKALSRHADDVYQELPDDEHRRVCRMMFRCLSDSQAEQRLTRRLVTVEQVAEAAGTDVTTVIEVADRFRQSGCNFLMPPSEVELTAESTLDISHESLIRHWEQLQDWLAEESEWADIYTRLSRTARKYYADFSAGRYRPPELTIATRWRRQAKPTPAWAARYDDNFDQAMKFLDDSFFAAAVRGGFVLFVVGLIVLLGIFAGVMWKRANDSKKQAIIAKQDAQLKQGQAEKAKQSTQEVLNVNRVSLAYSDLQNGDLRTAEEKLQEAQGTADAKTLGWAWKYVRGQTDLALWTRKEDNRPVTSGESNSQIAFCDGGRQLLTVDEGGTARWLDARTGRQLRKTSIDVNPGSPDDPQPARAVAIDPRTQRFAIDNRNGTITVCDPAQDPPEHHDVSYEGTRVGQLAFTPDGERLVATVDTEGARIDQQLPAFSAKQSWVKKAPLSSHGQPTAPSLVVWKLGTEQPICQTEVSPSSEVPLRVSPEVPFAVSPDGRWIVFDSCQPGEGLNVMDASQGMVRGGIDGAQVSMLTFHPGGRWLFVVNRNRWMGEVEVLRLSADGSFEPFVLDEDIVGEPDTAATDEPTTAPAGARECRTAPAATAARLLADSDRRHVIYDYRATVESLACTPDGSTLVCGGTDGRLAFIDLTPLYSHDQSAGEVGEVVPGDTVFDGSATPQPVERASDHDVGTRISTLRKKPYVARRPRVMTRCQAHAAAVRRLAIHPEGGLLATCDAENEIRLSRQWRVSPE